MNRFKLIFAVVLCSALATGCLTGYPSLPKNAIPQVVTVTSFENRSGFSGKWNLGSGMADLLVSELMKSRNFVLVERTHLQTVVEELELQKDDHFRPEGKVDTKRLKNAKYLVRGTINDFSQIGGGSLSVFLRSIVFGGKGYRARVALNLTIVDVESGEILHSVQSSGVAHAGEAYVQTKYENVAFAGDAFFSTPLGEATRDAIQEGVIEIIKKMPKVFWEPMIADVPNSKNVFINGGRDRKLVSGTVFEVRGDSKMITDPSTGDVLKILPGPVIGRIKVVSVEDRISLCEIISGNNFKRGQRLSMPDAR